jgi:hypothetical protein
MLRFCGRRFRVARRIERSIIDFSGQMKTFNNTVALEGVQCSGLPLGACSRKCYHLWREAWLEKIEPDSAEGGPAMSSSRSSGRRGDCPGDGESRDRSSN